MTINNTIHNPGKHKAWLDNEYAEWVKALSECTVHNFKEYPVVRRMLGEPQHSFGTKEVIDAVKANTELMYRIDSIGCDFHMGLDSRCERYIYYALEILKLNPTSICEIGGGVGQFYATLRALGYKNRFCIVDLGEVEMFQRKYLAEVSRQTGLNTEQSIESDRVTLISFYALGEFDDETKQWYKRLIDESIHGYIAWNPHSGASDDLSIFSSHDIKVTPGIEPGIKIIQW